MEIGVISVRYARALLKGATDAHIEDAVYRDMQTLAASFAAVPQLMQTLVAPMLSKDSKLALLTTASGETPAKLTVSFLGIVLDNGREDIVQFMANSYITLYRKQKNIIRGRLTTAAAVHPATERKMRSMVESKTNGAVTIEIYPSGQLGGDADLINSISLDSGTVDIIITDASNFATYEPKMGISALPFQFADFEEAWA